MPTIGSRDDRWAGWLGASVTVGLSLGLGLAWTVRTQPFNAPDEPSHVNAVIQVMNTKKPPIAIFAFDDDPQGKLIHPGFDRRLARACQVAGQGDPLRLSAYESFQPPLYYLIVAAIAGPIADGPGAILMIGRCVSVLFGALTVLGIWLAVRRFAPDEPFLAVATAASIALIPQFAFNAATSGNDSTINALFALSFASWFQSLRDPSDDRWMIRSGSLVGLALLAKLSAMALLPGLVMLALVRESPANERRTSAIFRRAAGSFSAIAVVSGWWFVRNAWLLGDPLASRDAARYYRSRFVPFSIDSWQALWSLLEPTWQSFWGRFGWMDRPLPGPCYAWTLAIVAALITLSIARRPWRSSVERAAWLLMTVVFTFVVIIFLQINLTIGFQAQGRYLYPAALPIGLAMASGLARQGRCAKVRTIGLAAFWTWLVTMQLLGLLNLPRE